MVDGINGYASNLQSPFCVSLPSIRFPSLDFALFIPTRGNGVFLRNKRRAIQVLCSIQVWVLDSVPGAVPPEDAKGDVERVLDELHSLPEVIPSRK